MNELYAALRKIMLSFLSLLGEQEQNRKEKYPSRSRKRLRVIDALSHAYSSISLVNIKTEKSEIVKSSKGI